MSIQADSQLEVIVKQSSTDKHEHMLEQTDEKDVHTEHVQDIQQNYSYDDEDEEPELHATTWIALGSMCLLILAVLFALQGPPTVLTWIGEDLHNSKATAWIPTPLSLLQAVISPLISSVADKFQVRKPLLMSCVILPFIGSAIAPGSSNIYRVIVAQIFIGFGLALVPLSYCISSEIVPRRWRPISQAIINFAAAIGACLAPITIGGLTKKNPHTGWRNFYWVQCALWGATAVGIFIGYKPPKRHTRYDHLSFFQKLMAVDVVGLSLYIAGLTLFMTGANLGGGLASWTDVRTLAPLVTGCVLLVSFILYEWLGTKEGILNHELFRGGKARGRTFAICVFFLFVEGALFFPFLIFYPLQTSALFESDPLLLAAREQSFWAGTGVSTLLWGYASTKLKRLREPIFIGFVIFLAGMVGITTIEPDDSVSSVVFSTLAGIGWGSPLILVIAAVQLATPHHIFITATAVTAASRALAGTIFTAILTAVLNNNLASKLGPYISKAALKQGLPKSSINAFIAAVEARNATALAAVPGATQAIISAGLSAQKKAYAESLRTVFIITLPFGLLACIACLFMSDLRKEMNYIVDAPLEHLTAKHHHNVNESQTKEP
ncbi:hypothetical protein CLAIMM_03014 [Cladophialophora immunda]|nr:hypothetical protein CLAIMM_03014 [Cladophialophora immunda]